MDKDSIINWITNIEDKAKNSAFYAKEYRQAFNRLQGKCIRLEEKIKELEEEVKRLKK